MYTYLDPRHGRRAAPEIVQTLEVFPVSLYTQRFVFALPSSCFRAFTYDLKRSNMCCTGLFTEQMLFVRLIHLFGLVG
jgi:hypothetical protein